MRASSSEKQRVSLVIPAHNEEKYIGVCLEAVLRSRGAFSEIIVVDNASTDGTAKVAARFPGVRVVHEVTKGPTWARQRGFLEATGDILAYVDADTEMPRGWYETIVSEFRDSNLACLSGPQLYYGIPWWQQLVVRVYWYVLAMPVYFLVGYMVIANNFAIRRTVLERMHGFDTSVAFYGDDTNLGRRAHRFGKVQFKAGFVMWASPRRLKGQGVTKTVLLYILNFISEVVLKKPVTKGYTDVR